MTIDEDGSVLFRLNDLIMSPYTPDSLVVFHNGRQHLRPRLLAWQLTLMARWLGCSGSCGFESHFWAASAPLICTFFDRIAYQRFARLFQLSSRCILAVLRLAQSYTRRGHVRHVSSNRSKSAWAQSRNPGYGMTKLPPSSVVMQSSP